MKQRERNIMCQDEDGRRGNKTRKEGRFNLAKIDNVSR